MLNVNSTRHKDLPQVDEDDTAFDGEVKDAIDNTLATDSINAKSATYRRGRLPRWLLANRNVSTLTFRFA